jgi:hypothetical protein
MAAAGHQPAAIMGAAPHHTRRRLCDQAACTPGDLEHPVDRAWRAARV